MDPIVPTALQGDNSEASFRIAPLQGDSAEGIPGQARNDIEKLSLEHCHPGLRAGCNTLRNLFLSVAGPRMGSRDLWE